MRVAFARTAQAHAVLLNTAPGFDEVVPAQPERVVANLLWSPTGSPDHRVSLDFDAVTSWSEGTQNHRYALVLRHTAVERIGWAPAHKVLWFEWGDTEEMKQQTRTILHFSTRDTKVASAIRDQIARRNVPRGTPLEFDEQSREERFGTSMATLKPRDGEIFRGS